ncbi:hypothetical protein BCR44DRAFT_36433 [Catenaria anguillulae PL171]|uniref:Uncharacterized protein n=1 Tax=Catenaria anguillulae PL171 TaxID=765915 RepID=A0A1Y2HDQ2_9FUNG|nr:hypothetical protein BCR44DRAFT_36433 [Catenaria anguillulae PL171]
METAHYLADQFIGPDARTRIRSSAAFNVWRHLEAMSLDIDIRCRDIERAMQVLIIQRNSATKTWVLTTFILLVVVSLAAFACFIYFGVNKLKREAAALVLLLHMVPPALVKEQRELSGFLESGGLTLIT